MTMNLFTTILAGVVAGILIASFTCRAEELKIGAGSAPAENILKPLKSAFEEATDIQLIIIESGPKVAFTEFKRANLDAAAAGFSYEEWQQLMTREGVPADNLSQFQSVGIGTDRIVVITHKNNPVQTLTADQLRGIFSGRIENWKEVGGDDAPVMIVWGTLMQDDNTIFQERILRGAALSSDLLDTTTATEVRANVAANPNAIGIGPGGIVDESVTTPAIPDLMRDIILLTKANPSESVKKLLDFIQNQGKQLIKR
jgi:phosphate transport system substrate-binding protein